MTQASDSLEEAPLVARLRPAQRARPAQSRCPRAELAMVGRRTRKHMSG